MRIEIWSDVVCPWCYVGKRRLETALAGFDHAGEVEVVWRSFQLDPGAPREATQRTRETLARKYGLTPEKAGEMQDQLEAVAAEEGLLLRLGETMHVNTVDAHRLIHLALHEGGTRLQGELKEALLEAYFVGARNVADHEVLADVASSVGLAPARVAEVLSSTEYEAEVWADIEQAQRYGASGVPFFVVDGKYGVSGAQPAETFSQVLERAWADAHPSLTMVDPGGAEVCGPDGCTT